MGAEIKTNELRLYAIQTRTEITFRAGAQVCVMSPQGILKIPGISGPPAYNAEEVLARADTFTLAGRDKSQTVNREAMAELLKARTPTRAAAVEKEE